jgi:hypothetical protein
LLLPGVPHFTPPIDLSPFTRMFSVQRAAELQNQNIDHKHRKEDIMSRVRLFFKVVSI